MSLDFHITETIREFDARDGYRYRAITKLDFHQGWYTRLQRTKLSDNDYPMWTHGGITEALTELFEWSPTSAARPIFKFMSFLEAERWLELHFAEAA